MTDRPLDGIGVLVTRPEDQAGELADAIERRGGGVRLLPVLAIVPRDRSAVASDAAGLPAADVTIYISRNAVAHGIEFAHGDIAAIGSGTARAIEAAGRRVAIEPTAGFDSDALLAHPAFADVRGKTVRIVRGSDGRKRLAEALRERGARVDYLAAYERRLPVYDDDVLGRLEHEWLAGDIDAVVVMSVQSLDNLLRLLPERCRETLPSTPLVTPAARVIKEALKRIPGCRAVLARAPDADTIADSLTAVRNLRRNTTPDTDRTDDQ